MDLTIDRASLAAALARAAAITPRTTTNPALCHVLIDATAAGVALTASDTQLTLTTTHAANVEGPGRITADASTLLQVAKAMAGDTVRLKAGSNQRLTVASGSAQFNILGGDPDDFPPLPTQTERARITVQGGGLRRILEETLFSVSADENRYGLNGGFIQQITTDAGAPALRLASTDGSRLSYSETAYQGDLKTNGKMLIPRRAMAEIRKMIADDTADWSIAFGDRSAVVSTAGLSLIVRLVEGEFPDYRQVLPTSFKRRAELDRGDLDKALRNVSIMATDRNHLARFRFEADRLVLTAANVEAGDARSEVPIDMVGTPIDIGFNVRFLQDVLANTRSDRVLIELGQELDPCIVRLPGRDDCLFVVMPMRLD